MWDPSYQDIKTRIQQRYPEYYVEHHATITSTNTRCLELLARGKSAVIVTADQQSQGRGRMGHSFFSPDSGIYLTVGFSIHSALKQTTNLTARAAVATLLAIDRMINEPQAMIKWVNDIYLNNRKVAGILTQIEQCPKFPNTWNIALGVGINLSVPSEGFPEDLQSKAGTVFEHPVTDIAKVENILVSLHELSLWLSPNVKSKTNVLNIYRERQLLNGQAITYQYNSSTNTGIVIGIDEQFHLIIQSSSGEIHALNSGEVHILNWQ